MLTFKCEVHSYVVSKFPEHLLYFVELVDISKQKRLQRLREDTERIIRHDLKAPLNGIIGFAQLLLDDDLTSSQKDDIQIIYKSGLELRDLMESSLDIFKMEEKTYVLNLQSFDLLELLRELDKKIIQLQEAHLVIYIEGQLINEQSIYLITAEKKHIKSVLNNLVKNALEASPKNEAIKIKLSNQKGVHLISIINKGEIPQTLRATFFEKYSTQNKTGGTGIGTYSAKLIIDSHQGALNFQSEQGETALNIKLPRLF